MRRAALLLPLVLSACQGGLTDKAPLPTELERQFFDCHVQPVLAKSCAALACHGDPARYLHVFARNRSRMSADESLRNRAMTEEERRLNFDVARAYVEVGSPGTSWLLLKPLGQAAGGYYHGGEALYKRGNVFTDEDDEDYQVLARWVNGEKAKPNTDGTPCTEPGSDQ